MIEFEQLSFKQAVTYSTNDLIKIPLKDQGSVYLGGVNGSGKSIIFNVLFNVLFGYTPLSTKGKRKLIANKDYYAQVDFKFSGGNSYTIKQFFDNSEYGNGYDVLENGKSLGWAGGIPECEKKIAKLLPFTPDEFCGFYYLTQDMLHVLVHGKGSERLNYLSRVFGFDIYDKIRVELKDQLDELDLKLTDAMKAQEEVDRIQNKLLEYPSLDLLDHRISLYQEHLRKAKIEKSTLDTEGRKLEKCIITQNNRTKLEESLKDYNNLREVKEITKDLDSIHDQNRKYEEDIQTWKRKEKLLNAFEKVKSFVSKDIDYLNTLLDRLNQKKGKATTLNKEVAKRLALESDISRYNKKLKETPEVIEQQYISIQQELIENKKILKDKKIIVNDFQNLKDDGGKCSRCGHALDAKHIKKELIKLKDEIALLSKKITQQTREITTLSDQVDIISKLKNCNSILKSIAYNGERIDISKLSSKINQVKLILENTKDAKRLQKELNEYKIDKESYIEAKEQLNINKEKILVLQQEYNKAKAKETILHQLSKLPAIAVSIGTLSNKLKKIQKQLTILDETVPTISADIKEAETLKEVVFDYINQIKEFKKKTIQIESMYVKRKILNACYKAYAAKNLKKIQVVKISQLIAQKLNIFVPLIFNEDISFVTDPDENSVDILFKRGDQPLRDVRFLNGGFKKRFLIALIPTLAGLVSVKKRCNLIILDEIDANVDNIGRDAIGEFLIPYLKKKFKTIIVISPSHFTHDGQLEAPIPLDHFDKIWTASYKNGISYLNF